MSEREPNKEEFYPYIDRFDKPASIKVGEEDVPTSFRTTSLWVYPPDYMVYSHIYIQNEDGSYYKLFDCMAQMDDLHEMGYPTVHCPWPTEEVQQQFFATERAQLEYDLRDLPNNT